jgi:uncharacterized protein YcbX
MSGTDSLQVAEIWRYPVKSLRGEQIQRATIGGDGIPGDRIVHVRGSRGLLTGRTRSRLLTITAHAGADARAERRWPGRALRIADTVIGVHSLRPRCVVTTIDPDTGEQDLDVFRRIRREFDGSLALNCWVIEGGSVRVGDPVDVVPLPHEIPADAAARPCGWVTGMPYPGAASRGLA